MLFLPWRRCWKRPTRAFGPLLRVPDTERHRNVGIRWNSNTGVSRMKSIRRDLITLRPSEMLNRGQQVHDLSGYKDPRFRTHGSVARMRYSFVDDPNRKLGFPQGSTGVFYYHHDANRPPTSGAIRFRICDDASSFEEGRDLSLLDRDQPWEIPLYLILTGSYYSGVRPLLERDKLVDAQVLNDLYNQRDMLPINNPICQVVYDITDPFDLDLSHCDCNIYFIEQSTTTLIRIRPFIQQHAGKMFSPYIGKLRVRFVPATTSKATTGSQYHLQTVDIISPVQCVAENYNFNIREPRVGELISRRKYHTAEYVFWTYDLTKKRFNRRLVRHRDDGGKRCKKSD